MVTEEQFDEEPASPRVGRALRGALLALALALGASAWWVVGQRSTGVDLRGVRIGLSAADTRARFLAPGPGVWASESSPEPSLRWSASGATDVREAVFEFHQGMLVAVRLKVSPKSPEATGPSLEQTPARVISRQAEGDAVAVTLLSRSCPAHAAEVAKLLGSKPLAWPRAGQGRGERAKNIRP